jgi:hypothetical protein
MTTFIFDNGLGHEVPQITGVNRATDLIEISHDAYSLHTSGPNPQPLIPFPDEWDFVYGGRNSATDNPSIMYNRDNGKVFYDADGYGGHDAALVAIFDDHPKLNADDFMLII